MDKRKRNIAAVGILTIIATIAFFWSLYWLLGSPMLQGGTEVIVKLGNGGGLKRSDRVLLQGVDVGSVRRVELGREGGVLAELRLNNEFALPVDTRAAVVGDVFGAHTVELVPGKAMLQLQDGDTIKGAPIPQIMDVATRLSTRAESILASTESLLSPTAVRDIHATAALLPSTTEQLRASFSELRAAAASLRRTTEAMEAEGTGAATAGAIHQVEQSARTLNAAALKMDASMESLASVLQKIDRGQGTLGRMVNDSSAYIELHETLREVRALATDIRLRPKKYIDLKIF